MIFDTAERALDVLCPLWRDIIIFVPTDGEKKMTGRSFGVAKRFDNVTKLSFILFWCGAYQSDIVLQDAYCELVNDTFYTQLNSLISYIWQQQNLVLYMRKKAPKVSDTR